MVYCNFMEWESNVISFVSWKIVLPCLLFRLLYVSIFPCAILQGKKRDIAVNPVNVLRLTYLGPGKQGRQRLRGKDKIDCGIKLNNGTTACQCVLGRNVKLSQSFGGVVADIYLGGCTADITGGFRCRCVRSRKFVLSDPVIWLCFLLAGLLYLLS